jgi:hypothetical protein
VAETRLIWAIPVFFISTASYLALNLSQNPFTGFRPKEMPADLSTVISGGAIIGQIAPKTEPSVSAFTSHCTPIAGTNLCIFKYKDGTTRIVDNTVTASIKPRALDIDEQTDNAATVSFRIGQNLERMDALIISTTDKNLTINKRYIRNEIEIINERVRKLINLRDDNVNTMRASSLAVNPVSFKSNRDEKIGPTPSTSSILSENNSLKEHILFIIALIGCVSGVLSAYPAYRLIKRARA